MPNDQSISINNYLKQLYSTFSIPNFFNAAYFSKTPKTSSFFSFLSYDYENDLWKSEREANHFIPNSPIYRDRIVIIAEIKYEKETCSMMLTAKLSTLFNHSDSIQ